MNVVGISRRLASVALCSALGGCLIESPFDALTHDTAPSTAADQSSGDTPVPPGWGDPPNLPDFPFELQSVAPAFRADRPNKNPLKGWNAAGFRDQAESSVGFQNLIWSDIVIRDETTGEVTLEVSEVEKILSREGSKSRHFIMKLYCDWGTTKEASELRVSEIEKNDRGIYQISHWQDAAQTLRRTFELSLDDKLLIAQSGSASFNQPGEFDNATHVISLDPADTTQLVVKTAQASAAHPIETHAVGELIGAVNNTVVFVRKLKPGCPTWLTKPHNPQDDQEDPRVPRFVAAPLTKKFNSADGTSAELTVFIQRELTNINDPVFHQAADQVIGLLAKAYNPDGVPDPRLFAIMLGFLGNFGEWHYFGMDFEAPPAGYEQASCPQSGRPMFEFRTARQAFGFNVCDSSRQAILDSWLTHFGNVPLMTRYPADEVYQLATVDASGAQLGYHNGFFKTDSDHMRERFDDPLYELFTQTALPTDHWYAHQMPMGATLGPVGGEAPPDVTADTWASLYAFTPGDLTRYDGKEAIERALYTVMKPGAYRDVLFEQDPDVDPDNLWKARYWELHNLLGYNYHIARIALPAAAAPGTWIPYEIDVENRGVAPISQNWTVEVALLRQGQPRASRSLDGLNPYEPAYKLAVAESPAFDYDYVPGTLSSPVTLRDGAPIQTRQIIPGQPASQWRGTLTLPGETEPGTYYLATRIVQPGATSGEAESWNHPTQTHERLLEARNTFIRFASDLPVVEGKWVNQRLLGGWTILKALEVLPPMSPS